MKVKLRLCKSSRYTVDCQYKFAPSLILEFDEYIYIVGFTLRPPLSTGNEPPLSAEYETGPASDPV